MAGDLRPAEEHLPVVIGARRGHEQLDGEAAMRALARAGFRAAPMGTLAVCALAVTRLRTTALRTDALLRAKFIDAADELEQVLEDLRREGE